MNPVTGENSVALFCRSIPFNFFSLIAALAMVLFCFEKLPRSRRLREAENRVKSGGELWPEGSERYLIRDDTEVWGKIRNLLLPVIVLAISSLLVRSLRSGSFVVDSACGLVVTLVFMFVFYCAQDVLTPDQFFDHLVSGLQSMVLHIVLYLLTMCLTSLLKSAEMGLYFDQAVLALEMMAPLLPSVLFFVSTLLTIALGSSWAMYVIGFPTAIRLASVMGLSIPLCAGAICAAGIAGEKLCVFTSDSLSIGNAIGCDPGKILSVRMPYSICFFLVSLLLYIIAGFLM
jgi:Na+/H+ antiporter NhaC